MNEIAADIGGERDHFIVVGPLAACVTSNAGCTGEITARAAAAFDRARCLAADAHLRAGDAPLLNRADAVDLGLRTVGSDRAASRDNRLIRIAGQVALFKN